jgi:hypothetical protein
MLLQRAFEEVAALALPPGPPGRRACGRRCWTRSISAPPRALAAGTYQARSGDHAPGALAGPRGGHDALRSVHSERAQRRQHQALVYADEIGREGSHGGAAWPRGGRRDPPGRSPCPTRPRGPGSRGRWRWRRPCRACSCLRMRERFDACLDGVDARARSCCRGGAPRRIGWSPRRRARGTPWPRSSRARRPRTAGRRPPRAPCRPAAGTPRPGSGCRRRPPCAMSASSAIICTRATFSAFVTTVNPARRPSASIRYPWHRRGGRSRARRGARRPARCRRRARRARDAPRRSPSDARCCRAGSLRRRTPTRRSCRGR